MPGGRGDLQESKMSEWERVFQQNLVLPPHCQRRRARRPGSTTFCCVLKYLEGATLSQGAEYQLRLSLFDATYHHFFGRTWRSAWRAAHAVLPGLPRARFNEVMVWELPCATVAAECHRVPPAVVGAGSREQCFFMSAKEQPPALRHCALLSIPGN